MPRLRVIGLTLLALAVPTLALGGEEAPSEVQTLSVSASLSGCGLADAAIVCQIDTSWTALEGADYYTVSVTRADGSVVDLGQSSGTGRAIFVPYVGPGRYSVQVAAWGTPPGEDEPEVLVREKAFSTDESEGRFKTASKPGARGPAGDGRTFGQEIDVAPVEDGRGGEAPGDEPPACEDPEAPESPEPPETDAEAPVEDEPPVPDEADEPDPDDPDDPDNPDDPPACP